MASVLATAPAVAQTVDIVKTESDVIAVVQTPRGAFIETKRGSFSIAPGPCAGGLCLEPAVIRGLPQRAPEGALPDGKVATALTGDIVRAWYSRPTGRYAHGVLGDAIEGGSLKVQTKSGKSLELVLPQSDVFEDITPRIFDFGGNGSNEVVTISASQTGGARVVVYGLRDGALVQIAQSTENGRPNRWLNIVGVHGNDIVFVRTPHIGGRLFSLRMQDNGQWKETDRSALGRFSNHVIGSRELALGHYGPSPFGDGVDLLLPSQDRQSLIFANRKSAPIPLPGKINKALIAVQDFYVTATENGQLLAIKR